VAKVQTSFFCRNCGAHANKWIGKCPACGEWNTYVEEIVMKETGKGKAMRKPGRNIPLNINDISPNDNQRIITADAELNRVLGGGIVPGSMVLIGGEPGIGKSTLLLQLALNSSEKVLYISGEESEQQLKMRAERIGIKNNHCYILAETSLPAIFTILSEFEPGLVIVDSIQTLHTDLVDSGPGSITQIRECTGELLRYSKESNVPVILIGHITKDGAIAGPKVLEHMVDTVIQFEGDRHYTYRLLRTTKNRFGSTSELGIYEMQGSGLREVSNPSEILITQRDEPFSGIAIAVTIEGLRPMLIETQALVSSAVYGTPQRTSTGFDLRRLNMLLAVLEKKSGFKLGTQDVFINLAGGIKADDPGTDLAIISAILSSYEDVPISPRVCFAGEVGLSGEIRAVNRIEQRVAEAQKLGFEEIFISKFNKKQETSHLGQYSIRINMVSKIDEVFEYLFG
jgi:DNA repair protein RadA/Sms